MQQGVGFRVVRPEGLELSTFWFVARAKAASVWLFHISSVYKHRDLGQNGAYLVLPRVSWNFSILRQMVAPR